MNNQALFLTALGYVFLATIVTSSLGPIGSIINILMTSLVAFFIPFIQKKEVFYIIAVVALIETVKIIPALPLLSVSMANMVYFTEKYLPSNQPNNGISPFSLFPSFFFGHDLMAYLSWMAFSFVLICFVMLLSISTSYWLMKTQHFYERVGNTYPHSTHLSRKHSAISAIPKIGYSFMMMIIIAPIPIFVISGLMALSSLACYPYLRASIFSPYPFTQVFGRLFHVSLYSIMLKQIWVMHFVSFIFSYKVIMPKIEGDLSRRSYKI